MSDPLTNTTVTFGKYKGSDISIVLRDRSYCKWLIDQDWFKENYEFLYNRIEEYDPKSYFLEHPPEIGSFVSDYPYFNLIPVEDLKLELTDDEIKCYKYYTHVVTNLKKKIKARICLDDPNPYNIKAPTKWLQLFEDISGCGRAQFKEFISTYEFPNITDIVERIKKEGGLDYKGAKSYTIAKERSLKQERFWEEGLKKKYGEDLSIQFKYQKCLFDFLNISNMTIFECKLGLKDFNEPQYIKYTTALKEYMVIYLVGTDSAIDCVNRIIYTTNPESYGSDLLSKTKRSKFEEHLLHFKVKQVQDIDAILDCLPSNEPHNTSSDGNKPDFLPHNK
jgi:hypothetical protein